MSWRGARNTLSAMAVVRPGGCCSPRHTPCHNAIARVTSPAIAPTPPIHLSMTSSATSTPSSSCSAAQRHPHHPPGGRGVSTSAARQTTMRVWPPIFARDSPVGCMRGPGAPALLLPLVCSLDLVRFVNQLTTLRARRFRTELFINLNVSGTNPTKLQAIISLFGPLQSRLVP